MQCRSDTKVLTENITEETEGDEDKTTGSGTQLVLDKVRVKTGLLLIGSLQLLP